MSSVPLGKYSRVIGMLFEGYSTREIGEVVGMSAPSVSNLKKDFVKRAEKVGLMNAAQGSLVEKQVEDLIELGKKVKGLKRGFASVKDGAEYGESFEKIDVEPKDVSRWIEETYRESLSQGLKGEEVGPLLRRLTEATGESGLGFNETVKAMEESSRRRDENEERARVLGEEIAGLEDRKSSSEAETKAALIKHSLTQEKLDEITEALEHCSSAGVNLEDTVALSHLITRMVQEKKQYEEILGFYGRDKDLDRERDEKNREVEALKASKTELEAEIVDAEKTLNRHKDFNNVYEYWRKSGLTPVIASTLLDKVIEYAARNGLDKREAVERFRHDLEEHWAPTLGFGNQYNAASKKLDMIKVELANTEGLLNVTKEAYDSTREAVKAKEALNMRGVSDEDIVAWDKVLKECGTDPPSFREEMRRLGGIRPQVETKRAEVREAEKRLDILRSETRIEKSIYDQYEASNDAFKERFDKVVNPSLQRIEEKMAEVTHRLFNQENGIEPRMKSAVDSATQQFNATVDSGMARVSDELKLLNEEIKRSQTEFKAGVDSAITRVEGTFSSWESERDKTLEAVYELGAEVQKYKNLHDLMTVMNGEAPKPLDFTLALLALLEASAVYYAKINQVKISNEIKGVKISLIEEMRAGKLPT